MQLGEDFWFVFTILSLFQDPVLNAWTAGPGANVTDPEVLAVTTLPNP